MAKKLEVYISDYLEKFFDKVEKKNSLHFEIIKRDIRILEKVGFSQAMKSELLKRIRGRDFMLLELRVSTSEKEYRLMGTLLNNDRSILFVHGFVKKDQKTREKDINLTIRRLKSI